MMYSRWATKEEIKDRSTKLVKNSKVEKSGIQLMYDDKAIYIKDDEAHSLVIGSTGSGKTQSLLLPQLRLAIKSEESFVVHDPKGEICDSLSEQLAKNGYNTIRINLNNPTDGDSFNPFTIPYSLYKENNRDYAIDALENIGYYLLSEENFSPNSDPFWVNSAISLFVGLSLYMFEKYDEKDINLNSIIDLSSKLEKVTDYVKPLETSNPIYLNLSSIVLAPPETKGSIVSVFNQKLRLFASREVLSSFLSKTSFDLRSIRDNKTAIFIITENKPFVRRLVSLFIDELYYSAYNFGSSKRRFNFYVDQFEYLLPIKNFNMNLSLARGCNIKFCIFVNSLLELINQYGKENVEILKINFGNIVYLLANDIETLEDVSRMCGREMVDNEVRPLITVEELKLLDKFEAIIIVPRMYPIRTKLLPDYKIEWE